VWPTSEKQRPVGRRGKAWIHDAFTDVGAVRFAVETTTMMEEGVNKRMDLG
jgi:hypothetical protein